MRINKRKPPATTIGCRWGSAQEAQDVLPTELLKQITKQETYQLGHFNNYLLFLVVSRNSLWGLAEKAVGESTHVLAECNEFKGFVDKRCELLKSARAPRLRIQECGLRNSQIVFEIRLCIFNPKSEISNPKCDGSRPDPQGTVFLLDWGFAQLIHPVLYKIPPLVSEHDPVPPHPLFPLILGQFINPDSEDFSFIPSSRQFLPTQKVVYLIH